MMNSKSVEDISDARILFVDDEEDILDILSREFSGIFRHISTASNGEAAKKIVSENQLDLAVLDLRMPDMDGLTLFGELKKIDPALRCIFLSGCGDKASVQKALQLGAENFIDKPFESAFLRLAVMRAVEHSRFERLLKEVLELFIYDYAHFDAQKFDQLTGLEKEKTVRAALAVAKVQILKKNQELSKMRSN